MKRLFAIGALLATLVAPVSAQLTMTGVGGGSPASGGGAFSGAVDAVASPVACWSLQACSAALKGNAVANVCNSTGGVDVGCADMFSDATTGGLVTKTISGISCPGANCTVKTLYFQTGSLTCSIACDMTNATVAARPTLDTSCGTFGVGYCMTFSGSQVLTAPGLSVSLVQPLTFSVVSRRTGGVAAAMLAGNTTNEPELFYAGTFPGNLAEVWAGGGATPGIAATDSAWHSFQGVFNNTSSLTNADAVNGTTGSAGTTGISSTNQILLGDDGAGALLTGQIVEALIYPIAFAAPGNSVTMCHNQFTRFGTSTSC